MTAVKDIHHSQFVKMINTSPIKVELPTDNKELIHVYGTLDT